MRRLLRSAFWLLVVATLIAPIPMGESAAAQAPVCCLGKGEHDCLGHMLGGPDAPGLSAASKCPYSPLALAAMHGPELTPPVDAQQLIVAAVQSAAVARESDFAISSLSVVALLERGPPSSL